MKFKHTTKRLLLLPILFFSITAFAQGVKTIKDTTTKPFILGLMNEIASKELGEKRTLNIYLPAGYQANDTIKYPVVYLLDGSADEDFIHVVGLFQFNNFPWVNRVPNSIIVGIANTDRKRDFTFPTTSASDKKLISNSGGSARFINFMEKELQPFIEKKYHCGSSKMLIGESLGGLLATEILFTRPGLFNKYMIISPSLWWDNASILSRDPSILKESFTQKTDIYIGVGKEGLTPSEPSRVMEVDANLLADKIKSTKSKSVTVHFDYLPEENHATIGHQAVFNALRLLHPVSDQGK